MLRKRDSPNLIESLPENAGLVMYNSRMPFRWTSSYFGCRRVVALFWVVQMCMADEGLWLFNQFPHKLLEQQHHVGLSASWLQHLRLSTVNLSSTVGPGQFRAGAFVSPHGLIAATGYFAFTPCIVQVQRRGEDLLESGFYAQEMQDERTCPGLQANVLISIEDVTIRVRSLAARNNSIGSEEAILQASAAEERACSTPSVRCNVVPLHAGALLHLYRYQVYRDVRLVFAPEEHIAFYGGDDDDFNFPRWSMPICFFRIWDNQQPVETADYLRWSATGPRKNELVFQSSNARTTDRARPVSFLEVDRDVVFPDELVFFKELIGALSAADMSGDKEVEVAMVTVRSSAKGTRGRIAALQNSDLIRRKRAEERRMDQALPANRSSPGVGKLSRAEVESAAGEYRGIARDYWLLEAPRVRSQLLVAARWIMRWAEESSKSESERLPEYQSARISSEKKRFLEFPTVNKKRESAILTGYLRTLHQVLGESHPISKQLFSMGSPESVAVAAVEGSKLSSYEVRKEWVENTIPARIAQDPLVRIAAMLDVYARRARITFERAQSIQHRYTAAVTRAQFENGNKFVYPEATGTLRITWGKVSGFGSTPHATRIEQWLMQNDSGARRLPVSFRRAREALDLNATVTFVSTVDVANGHAGPTVDHSGNLVGMLFDSNYAHIGNAYLYLEEGSRAIHMSFASKLAF